MNSEELDAKFNLPRLDKNLPKIMFRKWTDYFPDSIPDDDEEDDDELWNEEDEKHGVIIAHQIHGGSFGGNNMPDVNKLFNFYVCSVNFRLTKAMFNELNNNVAGVETLDKISPYKIRIGIGELFDEFEVQRRIKDALQKCLSQQKIMG